MQDYSEQLLLVELTSSVHVRGRALVTGIMCRLCVCADVWHLRQVFACTETRNPLGACPAFRLFARPYGYNVLRWPCGITLPPSTE